MFEESLKGVFCLPSTDRQKTLLCSQSQVVYCAGSNRKDCSHHWSIHRHWSRHSQPLCSGWCHSSWHLTVSLAVSLGMASSLGFIPVPELPCGAIPAPLSWRHHNCCQAFCHEVAVWHLSCLTASSVRAEGIYYKSDIVTMVMLQLNKQDCICLLHWRVVINGVRCSHPIGDSYSWTRPLMILSSSSSTKWRFCMGALTSFSSMQVPAVLHMCNKVQPH